MNQFRLHVDDVATQWYDEESRSVIADKVSRLRAANGPEARIRVERDYEVPRKPQEWVRFVVAHKNGSVQYSNAMPKSEADKVGAEIANDYPKATITRQEWVK